MAGSPGIAEPIGTDAGAADKVGPDVAAAGTVTGAVRLVGEGLRNGVGLFSTVSVAVMVGLGVAEAVRDGAAGCAVDRPPRCCSRPGHESQAPAASASRMIAPASPVTQARSQPEPAGR
jgi:hypothetical protein